MSFRMGVQEDKVLPPGPYQAVLDDIEIKQTAHGERLMWTFGVPSENAQVVGFSSLNEKTSATAYQWASAIAGEIDPKEGWGPKTVKGKRCTIYVDIARDAQGREKNKVQHVHCCSRALSSNCRQPSDLRRTDQAIQQLYSFAPKPALHKVTIP